MNHSSSDIDELLRCRSVDDRMVIETIVEQYGSAVHNLALTIMIDPDEADDAAQDALINAIFHINDYRPGTNFKSWLYTITVNVCRGYLRKHHRRMNLEAILSRLYLRHPIIPDPENTLLKNETDDQLWDAVKRLDEKYRLVITLRMMDDLSIAEIASILKINEKTVYSRLYEAFRKLHILLKSVIGND